MAKQLRHSVMYSERLDSSVKQSTLNSRLSTPISGFQVTTFPLSQLGCLCSENYIEEDVVNALSELLYFRLAVKTCYPKDPDFLFFPTLFLGNATNLSDAGVPVKLVLQLLQERVNAMSSVKLAYLSCNNDHYAAYRYDMMTLDHGDSLDGGPMDIALSAINAVLAGSAFSSLTAVHKGTISQQGFWSLSCGIAAFNFVEAWIDPSVPHWENSSSDAFREQYLADLLRYHFIAQKHIKVSLSTTRQIYNSLSTLLDST